mmetsp:Transcript_9066/g.38418  ORF Transcript_9066/g.38418 Transcript_9066/m.38418 type:complete len:247 (+) Transcript_9066:621-1361(+)
MTAMSTDSGHRSDPECTPASARDRRVPQASTSSAVPKRSSARRSSSSCTCHSTIHSAYDQYRLKNALVNAPRRGGVKLRVPPRVFSVRRSRRLYARRSASVGGAETEGTNADAASRFTPRLFGDERTSAGSGPASDDMCASASRASAAAASASRLLASRSTRVMSFCLIPAYISDSGSLQPRSSVTPFRRVEPLSAPELVPPRVRGRGKVVVVPERVSTRFSSAESPPVEKSSNCSSSPEKNPSPR